MVSPFGRRHGAIVIVCGPYSTIGSIERGQYNPSLDPALRIAEYFELPVEALFTLRPFRPLTDEVYGRKQ